MPSPTRRFRSQSHRPDDGEQDFQERASDTSNSDEAPPDARDIDDEEAARLLKSDTECIVSSFDDLELEQHGYHPFRWSRVLVRPLPLLWSVRRRAGKTIRLFQPDGSHLDATQRSSSPKFRKLRRFAFVLLLLFAMLGVVQFIILVCGVVLSFFPEELEQAWDDSKGLAHWPTDATRDIVPVACHSHNDYWRPVPLFSAINAGCISVEADVWLIDEELYVGHSTSALTPNRTLRSLYVNPLVDLLEKQNPLTRFHPSKDHPLQGVFDTEPSQTLVLLIDFKTNGSATWPYVVSHLSPLRDRGYLSYYNGEEVINGPVTVVATGNAPFDVLTSNTTYRDIFFDAPLDQMVDEDMEITDSTEHRRSMKDHGQVHSGTPSVIGPETYNPTNSYYASVSFKESIGFPWHFHITSEQLNRIRAQINGAHRRGLKARYWGTPSWPRSLRNHVWSVLEREGVDVLNVDDLRSATTKDWRHRFSDWWY
ncbi:hypothetical protein VTN77DRAFT_8253 [Rasamsonia byssochlamydoides]|uniref:uncharacterized protein n=1 Tax=Rasamsonia byssochlamydoides TaxID=89139 RepID=UPI0037444834